MKKKSIFIALSLIFLICLSGCSKEEITEKLNEVLFVNKIIDYLEIEETNEVVE